MPIKAKTELTFRIPNIDLTQEMRDSADIIAQEIRGNIKRGTNPSESQSHKLNSPIYAKRKLRDLGHQKPLQAYGRTLISKDSYEIKVAGRNKVTLTLSNGNHPKSDVSIAEIGNYNHFGTNKIPARPFFEVSEIARKRVISFIADKIARVLRG